MLPVVVRTLLRPLTIEPRQVLPRRSLDPRSLRQTGEKLLVALAGVSADDATQRGVGLQRRGVNTQRPAPQQSFFGQHLQHPDEHLLVGLEVDQPPVARDRRVVRRRVGQGVTQKLPHADRVRHSPGNAALRVDAFKVAHQQHSEVDSRRQGRAANRLGVELLTHTLDKPIEATPTQDLVQPAVEGMARAFGQTRRFHPERSLPLFLLAHRHVWSPQELPPILPAIDL